MRRPLFVPAVLRLQVQPDKPGAIVAPRPRGSRRPHRDATVAAVRRLVENTALTYAEIAARTGVARASICRWTRDQGWKRHLFAPRATDTVPRERASARLRARTLAARLHALAERYVRELEETPSADLDKLGEALELLKMAKLAARPRRRRPLSDAAEDPRSANNVPAEQAPAPLVPTQAGTQEPQTQERVALDSRFRGNEREIDSDLAKSSSEATHEPVRAALLEDLHAAGVNVERAPQAAVEDFIASRTPPRELPPDDPALRRRGHRSKRNREHEWVLGRDDD